MDSAAYSPDPHGFDLPDAPMTRLASGHRRPRCVWCGQPISGLRFKSCRACYDLEQALRLYYNGGRENVRAV